MSSEPLIVRLEIQIPLTAEMGQPKIAVTPPVFSPPPSDREPVPKRVFSIDFPGPTANVKVSPGGTSGVICASGCGPLAPPYNTPPNVKVKIYNDLLQDFPKYTPDAGATDLGKADVHGFWGIDELGTAQCGPYGSGKDNRFVVWYEYPGVAPTHYESRIFTGICSSTTDNCGRQGSRPQAPQRALPSIIIPQWHLSVRGFAGKKLSAFSGKWTLKLNNQGDRAFLWTSKVKSEKVPHVELFLAMPCASRWKLAFIHGTQRVEYSMPASEWSPTGTNIFTTVHTQGLPADASVPASVVVTADET